MDFTAASASLRVEALKTFLVSEKRNLMLSNSCTKPFTALACSEMILRVVQKVSIAASSTYSVSLQYKELATILSPASRRRSLSSMVAKTEPAAKPREAHTMHEQQPSTSRTLARRYDAMESLRRYRL
jgi:hypothetical protein